MTINEFLTQLVQQCKGRRDTELRGLEIDGDRLVIHIDGAEGSVLFLGEAPAWVNLPPGAEPKLERGRVSTGGTTDFLDRFTEDMRNEG